MSSEQAGFWTLQAGILAENDTSIRLYDKAVFCLVETREKNGKLDGKCRDSVLKEKRSSVAGLE